MTIYFDTHYNRSMMNVQQVTQFGQTWMCYYITQSAGGAIKCLITVDLFRKYEDDERFVQQDRDYRRL